MSLTCFCKELTAKCKSCSTRCFCGLWLFNNFSNDELALLRTIGTQRKFAKGQTLFMQGDPANEIFLVKTGRIKLTKYYKKGAEVILDFLKSGEFFGEHAFIDEEVFPMHAIAIEETITCGARKADLEKLVLRNPNIGLKMINNMGARIATLTNRLGDMAIGDLEGRLHQLLIAIAKRHGSIEGRHHRIPFLLTHEELGFLANAHRVSVTKAISNLLKSGSIARLGRTYSIDCSEN